MKLALASALLAACAVEPPRDPDTYVARGVEGERCRVVELDNTAPIDAHVLRATFSGGRATVSQGTCAEPGPPLLVATARQPELRLPDGVAFALGAHAPLVVRGTDVEVEIVATHAATATAVVAEVSLPPVELAPNAARVVSGTLAAPLARAPYFAFAGHTARFGVGVRAAISVDAITDRVPVYLPVAFDPAAPPLQTIAPRTMPEGGELYVQCAYYNTGSEVAADHCGLWAYAAVER